MALKVSDLIYYAPWDASSTREEKQQALDEGAFLGYYQYATLDDIINNFLVSYVGTGKHLEKVKRYEVEFHAQRAMQEFSYDIVRSRSSIEVELSDRLSIPLPHDYVNYISIDYVDEQGTRYPVKQNAKLRNSAPYLQDDQFEYLYDNEGRHAEAEHSEQLDRWRDRVNSSVRTNRTLDYYYGYYSSEDYGYYYYTYYGRRFGSNAEDYNINGNFVIDDRLGQIHFGSQFQEGNLISMEYISDGLSDNEDFSKVYIHKFAEDAMYSYLLWSLSRGRKDIPEYVVNRYKKDKSAMMRNAKHRISNLSPNELIQTFRGINKWIKH